MTSSAVGTLSSSTAITVMFTLKFLFECAMNISYRVLRSRSRECIEQFREAHLVRITDGGLAVWLDPIRVLNPKVMMNLLPEFGVGMNLVRHCCLLSEANGFHRQPFIWMLTAPDPRRTRSQSSRGLLTTRLAFIDSGSS